MITYTLLALIIVFSLYCMSNREAMAKYMFHPYSIKHFNQHYRFLTHAFIHGDYMHLAFNCLALYSFGLVLENQFFGNPDVFNPKLGKVYYLILFTGGIYAASIAEYMRNKNNSSYSSLGASGAISSIMFCFIMVSPKSSVLLFFIPLPGWLMGILLLSISWYLIRRKRLGTYNDNISHESHFWGALFGIAFVLVLKPGLLNYYFKEISSLF